MNCGWVGWSDVPWRDGSLRATSVAFIVRTIQDLASAVGSRDLERAIEEAQVRRLVTRQEVDRLRSSGARPEPSLTRSEAERRAARAYPRRPTPAAALAWR